MTDYQIVKTVKRGFASRLPSVLVSLVLEYTNWVNEDLKKALNQQLMQCSSITLNEEFGPRVMYTLTIDPYYELHWLNTLTICGIDMCECEQHRLFRDCTNACRNGRNLVFAGCDTNCPSPSRDAPHIKSLAKYFHPDAVRTRSADFASSSM